MTTGFKRAAVKERLSAEALFEVWNATDEIVVFDTETGTDYSQRFKVGACLFKNRVSGTYRGFALFTAHDLSEKDRATVAAYGRDFLARLPIIAQDQVNIRAAELREQNEKLPAKKRKSADALTRAIETAEVSIRLAFGQVAAWIAACGRLPVWTRSQFASRLLDAMQGRIQWEKGKPNDASAVVALNALFDFGAIAAPHPAPSMLTGNTPVLSWGYEEKQTGDKGFAFHLCDCQKRTLQDPERVELGGRRGIRQRASCPDHPSIVSRHLGGRKNQYGLSGRHGSAPVLDLSVLGRALLGPGDASLRGLGDRMGASILKRKGETGHGDALTFEYLDYLMVDVLASAEICELQMARYAEHGMSAPIGQLFSEASVGKAYLADFGVPGDFGSREFRAADNGAPVNRRELFAHAQSAYQGARSEVMERLTVRPVIHCDFKSQYPSVNALMGLQSLLTGQSYSVIRGLRAIERASSILNIADHAWLRKAENWRSLRMIVKVKVAGCILPWKRPDPDTTGKTIFGMTEFTAETTVEDWYPLADIIASKLLTSGRVAEIVDAFEVAPVGMVQTNAKEVFRRKLDLAKDDLFVEVIEHRTKVKADQKSLAEGSEEYLQLENIQNNLKLIANATSYGVLAETTMIGKDERAGKYYAPFISAHITGGSRLLLATAQTLARDYGIQRFGKPIVHAMCDTDSMAFVQPEGSDYDAFDRTIEEICAYFSDLSPYRTDRKLFARELPSSDDMKAGVRAYFFGVSCKRYAMFNILDGQTIKLRKVSSHGLGHVRFDNAKTGDLSDETGEAEPDVDDLRALPDPDRLDKWSPDQGRMWVRAIERALGWRKTGSSEGRFSGFPREPWNMGVMRKPVGVTTPGLMLEFAALAVRPGSFFMTMPERAGSKLRVCMPRAGTTAKIMAGPFHDKGGDRLAAAQVERVATPIHEGLKDYFSIAERKAIGKGKGLRQEPGRLTMPIETATGSTHRNRKGQRVEDQGILFDDS